MCRARLLGSLHQPRTERGSRVHAWSSLTIPLGRLNSERPPLIWPRAILSSGLSPSRIPVKKLERYASTLCHQQDSQPTKHTHLLSEIQAQSVEDQGMHLNLHIVSVSFSLSVFPSARSGLPLLLVSAQDTLPSSHPGDTPHWPSGGK